MTDRLVEYRAACKDCRAGIGEWSDHNATAALMAREHALTHAHDTTVQTRRTTHDDAHTTAQEVPSDG